MPVFKEEKKRTVCPKCGKLHEMNGDNVCPYCHTHYKITVKEPVTAQTQVGAEKAQGPGRSSRLPALFSGKGVIKSRFALRLQETAKRVGSMKPKTKRLLAVLGGALVAFVLFAAALVYFFADREPVMYRAGKRTVQPVFFRDTEESLFCVFPSDKPYTAALGKGELLGTASSHDGRLVYALVREIPGGDGAESVDSLLRIRDFSEVTPVASGKAGSVRFACGGDCGYLYFTVTGGADFAELFLLKEKGEPKRIAGDVIPDAYAVSPNGRYCFFRVDDAGASKLLKYNCGKDECQNPGIRNSYPLSVDNKGEYLIYAKKSADSMTVVAEKSTSERVELPVIAEAQLQRIILTEDRRALCIEYADRSAFHTCGGGKYSTVLTYAGSSFGYDFTENAANVLGIPEIPELRTVRGSSLLPYYFFDKEREGVYCINKDGAKVPVFDRTFDEVKVSGNGRCAFVSDGRLYCARLDSGNVSAAELCSMEGKTLFDISDDGKRIFYTDSDGNLLSVRFGKAEDEPVKIIADADYIRFSKDGKKLLASADGVLSVISDGKLVGFDDSVIPECTFLFGADYNHMIYAKYERTDGAKNGRVGLYLRCGRKTVRLCDSFGFLYTDREKRIDLGTSFFADTAREKPSGDANVYEAEGGFGVRMPEPITDTSGALPNPAV